MATMQSFIDADSARRGIVGNQRQSAFLMSADFTPYKDLDGDSARAFFEANGYTVVASGDLGTNGVAVTECGWVLSTNGHLSYSPQFAQQTSQRLATLAGQASCEAGWHSWVDDPTIRSGNCTRCAEPYGDPS